MPPTAALMMLAFTACEGPSERDGPLDTHDSTPQGETGETSEDTEDTGPEPPPDMAWLDGTVELQLRTQDEDGDWVFVAWDESCFGEVWPYGDILVAAWVEDEDTGVTRWLDTDLISDPSVDPGLNSYSLALEQPGSWEVRVAAFLDKWQDRVIASSDPVGSLGEPVLLEGYGGTNGGVDLVIDTPYWCDYGADGPCPDCPSSWGDGALWVWTGEAWGMQYGGACCEDTLDVTGSLEIATPYNGHGEDGMVALFEEGTGEPWYAKPEVALEPTDEGASGEWSYTLCWNSGSYDLKGAWDSNGNTLLEFTDSWGKPVDPHGVPYDTITIVEEDLLDLRVLVPVDDAAPTVVPELRLSGEIGLTGEFDELLSSHPDAQLWVVAMRYGFALDEHELCADEIDEARDHQAWEPVDLVGQDALAFELTIPGHSPVHLGAWLDLDGDGFVGAGLEPAAWWGDGVHGLMEAGDEDQDGLVIEIPYP